MKKTLVLSQYHVAWTHNAKFLIIIDMYLMFNRNDTCHMRKYNTVSTY